MLIDTHCHLDSERFDGDRAAVLDRARKRGVQRFINIGCDVNSSKNAIALAATHDDILATVGLHPHEARAMNDETLDALAILATHPRCVAIGECGLDFYYEHSPRDVQARAFAAQIALARNVRLPLVVHVREAWDECLDLLAAENARDVGGVIHCFTSHWEHARKALDLGFYISIPGVVTFRSAGELPEVVPMIPKDRLLLETDAPYLAPVPHRGKRNEPAFVLDTAHRVAELRRQHVETLIQETGDNATGLFRLSSSERFIP